VAKGVLDLECPHGPSIEETRFMSNSQWNEHQASNDYGKP
jgi:hypothetical protein